MDHTLPNKLIYLAGPITGLTHDEARYGWREKFAKLLPPHIHCMSPMRGKEFLSDLGVLTSGENYPQNALCSPEGITTRDYNDVKNSDAIVACYLESGDRPSLGTAVEFGYAWAHHIPIIVIGSEEEVNVRHFMLKRMAGYRVDTLEEGALVTSLLLTPGI